MELSLLQEKIQRTKEKLFNSNSGSFNEKKNEGYVLFVQYYLTDNKERQTELDLCLKNNIENKAIEKIIVILENNLESQILNDAKIDKVVVGRRMKFSDAFRIANDRYKNRYCIVSNADIYFDESIKKARDFFEFYDGEKVFIALNRHNVFPDGTSQISISEKYDYKNIQKKYDPEGGVVDWGSQDAWIFESPVSEFLVENSFFDIGQLNSDGYLAWLAKVRGYKLLNPCFEIRANHLHNVPAGKTREDVFDHENYRIKGEHYLLNPDGSGERSDKIFIQGDNPKGKIKMYAIYSDSHAIFKDRYFLPSIRDDYFLVIKKSDQLCKTGEFESSGWIEAIIEKTEFIIDAVRENMGSFFIFSDVDIQFFGKTKDILVKLIEQNDIVFQQDTKDDLVNRKGPMPCTGFFVCKGNGKVLKLWEEVLARVRRSNVNEQTILANVLSEGKHKLKISFLPDIFWGPGKKYGIPGYVWRKGDEMDVPRDILMHHANWTNGIQRKVEQLEYIKDKVFKMKGFV